MSAEFVSPMSETFHVFQVPSVETDIHKLIVVLPSRLQMALKTHDTSLLMEVVLDLGRLPEARLIGGQLLELSQDPVTQKEIDELVSKISEFSSDNRAGIASTLHRISAIKNRKGDVVGLTCRVGKVVTGTIEPIEDIIESGKSILLLGRPGVGKTTKLREIAKLLSSRSMKRVVIIDTSNEIAGDGDIPHPAVGRARRMQVPLRENQKEVMIEAVQNHTPEVIVVDEIGTEEEALAARTIAERGVILVATAHGNTLENIIKNPTISDLVGGIETVTLGDDEAKRRSTQKTVLERAKLPTFDIVIEIRESDTLAIYPNVAEAVDHILRGWTLFPEIRKVNYDEGSVKVLQSPPQSLATGDVHYQTDLLDAKSPGNKRFQIYIYGVSKLFLDRILERLDLNDVGITRQITDANAIIALKTNCRPGSKLMNVAEDYEIPVFYARTNTMPQIQRALQEALSVISGQTLPTAIGLAADIDESEQALEEAEKAILQLKNTAEPVELSPRRSYIRRLQHELVEKHDVMSFSIGDEPNRRLRLVPTVSAETGSKD
jgi:stage III sporulation protein SpoIIIAA